jgi:GH24 family phage-related lysozyme (muramidase)
VIIQGLPAYRVGDSTVPHGFVLCVPHVTPLVSGSHNVFINGQPAGRVGDNHSCGVVVVSGSDKVMINGGSTGGGVGYKPSSPSSMPLMSESAPSGGFAAAVPGELGSYIQQKETFVSCAFLDGSQYTNGYGTEASSPTECISETEAKTRMDADLSVRRTFVTNYGNTHGYNWSDTQIDALTSFAYNLGTGAISQVTDGATRTDDVIANKMLLYNKSEGVVLPGLTQRRIEESDWFKSGMN